MIKLIDCEKIYPNGNVGLKKFNIDLPLTGLILLNGISGAGKSTFLNCFGGLDNFSSGKIMFNGKEVKDLSKYSTYVFQENKLFEDLSIIDNIKIANYKSSDDDIIKVLKLLKLDQIKDNIVNKISGGERQRTSIARAIINETSVLILDEPTSSLDNDNKTIIYEFIKEYSKNHLVLISSHDVDNVIDYTNSIIEIKEHNVTNKIENSDNNLNYVENDTKFKKLNSKIYFKLLKNYIVSNKIKYIFYFFISLLFVIFSLLTFLISTINFNEIYYKASKENSNVYLIYGYDSVKGIDDEKTNNQIYENANPNLTFHENLEFFFEGKYISTKDGKYNDFSINEDEILLDSTKYSDYDSNYFRIEDKELKVIGKTSLQFDNEQSANFVINYATLNGIIKDSNQYRIRMKIDGNDKLEDINFGNSGKLIAGNHPSNNNEVVVSTSFVDLALPLNHIIGKNVSLYFINYNNEVLKKDFTISGLSYRIELHDDLKEELCENYNIKSLKFTKNYFIEYDKSNESIDNYHGQSLYAINANLAKIRSFEKLIINIKPILISILIVSLIILELLTFNNIYSLIKKDSHNIGILKSFRIKNRYIYSLYYLDTLVIFIFDLIVSYILSDVILKAIYGFLEIDFTLYSSYILFNPISILFTLMLNIGVYLLTVCLLSLYINNRKKVDLLRN